MANEVIVGETEEATAQELAVSNNPQSPIKGISPILQLVASRQLTAAEVGQFIELQERFEANEARKGYNSAMAEFSRVLQPAKKNGYNSHLGNRYSTFDDIMEVVRPALSANGFNVEFKATQNDGGLTMTCRITHELGHYEEASLTSHIMGGKGVNDLQAMGLTSSYLKRYTVSDLTGVSTEDSDGEVGAEAEQQSPLLPKVSDESFASGIVKWQKNVNNGKSPSDILNFLTLKYTLSEEQRSQVEALKPLVAESQATKEFVEQLGDNDG